MASSPFAPQMTDMTLYDPATGRETDPSKNPAQPGMGLPPGAMTFGGGVNTGVVPPSNTPAVTPPSPFDSGAATNNLTAEYQSALHRAARPDEIQSYLPAVQQYGWDAVKSQIDNSPEAKGPAPLSSAPPAVGGGGPTPAMPKTAGLANSPDSSAFYDMIKKAIGTAGQSVDSNDPIIKAQTDAYRAEQERGGRSYLAQAAERGGSNVNLDAAARSVAEHGAQATAGFGAQMQSEERTQRRSQLQSLLATGGSFLTQQQQQQLQEELAQLDLQERAYEFDSNLGYLESPFASGAGA